MKAVVSVHKRSAYAYLNGHTFTVKSIYNSTVILDVNGVHTSFSFSEVFIVDIQKEMQNAFNDYNFYGNTTFFKLNTYCEKKGYKVDVINNCPA